MVTIKTKEEIDILREGGVRHAFILDEIAKKVTAGISTNDLETPAVDRKSTRLNSSHGYISYSLFFF